MNGPHLLAAKFVQKACRDFGEAVEVDGIIGPKTKAAVLTACAKYGPYVFLTYLVEIRRDFYYAIVEKDPSQKVFLKGWLNRVAEFEPTIGDHTTTLDMWKARALKAEATLAEVEAALIAFRRV